MKSEWSSNNLLHIPVLKEQVIRYLNINPTGIYIDGTIGIGGHASAIQSSLSPQGVLIGFDGDEEAIKRCKTSLSASSRHHLICDSYDNFPKHLKILDIKEVDGMLLDLGLSSFQLDSPERGFSYRFNGPLDMRFNRKKRMTAQKIVNSWDLKSLVQIFRDFGEEPRARRIAGKIVELRKRQPITTTFELRDIVKSTVGDKFAIKTLSRVFQALRITVNNELKSLDNFLNVFIKYLKIGGRIVVISYHSLEDRYVKRKFRELEKGCICPPELPVCQCGITPSLKILTKNPVVPSDEEIKRNKRARSAKLRAAEKIA